MPNSNTEMNTHSTISPSLLISACVSLLFVGAIPSHAEETTDRVSSIRVPGASKVFKAQSGADGAIHLLFDADNGPQYVKSRDGGVTFSAPIAVVDKAAQKPGLKFSAWDFAVA